MEFRFNRGCWVESSFDRLLRLHYAPSAGNAAGLSNHTSPTEERIHIARRFFDDRKRELSLRPSFAPLLERFRDCSGISRAQMTRLGIAEACARCDRTEPHGSCCSRGLEKKIDIMILVINLFLGVELPASRERRDSCFFLGADGCRLLARHMLCIDYLCPGVERDLAPDRLISMQRFAGDEIEAMFRLGEEIKRACLAAGLMPSP